MAFGTKLSRRPFWKAETFFCGQTRCGARGGCGAGVCAHTQLSTEEKNRISMFPYSFPHQKEFLSKRSKAILAVSVAFPTRVLLNSVSAPARTPDKRARTFATSAERRRPGPRLCNGVAADKWQCGWQDKRRTQAIAFELNPFEEFRLHGWALQRLVPETRCDGKKR